MNNFELIAAEKDNHRSLYNVALHEHNHFEIVYYLSGSGQIIIDNKQYEFEQNTFSFTITFPSDSSYRFCVQVVSGRIG